MRIIVTLALLVWAGEAYSQPSFKLVNSKSIDKTWDDDARIYLKDNGYVVCQPDTNLVLYLDADLNIVSEELIDITPFGYYEFDEKKVFSNGYKLIIDGELVEIKTRHRGSFYNPASFDHDVVGEKILVRRNPGSRYDSFNANAEQLRKGYESKRYLTVYNHKGKILDSFISQDSAIHFNKGIAWAHSQVPFGSYIPELETYFSNSPYFPTIRKYSLEGEYLGEFGVWPKESNKKPYEVQSETQMKIEGFRCRVESDFYGPIYYDLESEVLLRFFKYAEEDTVQLDSSYTNYILGLKDVDCSGVKKKDRTRCIRPNPVEVQQSQLAYKRNWHIQLYDPLSGELIYEFEPEFNGGGKRMLGINTDGFYVFSNEKEGKLVLEFVEFNAGKEGTSRAEP